ncbi:MAG: archaetidylserine decarboxylase [Proteobacteria bacterium]|nr:archaetidylserine decarboxylase [Pseudomonadota bacterium]
MLLDPARLAVNSLRLLPRKRISRAVGRLARVRAPSVLLRYAMDVYQRAYNLDLSEADIPAQGFASFDAFFTRGLKEGSRPIDPDRSAFLSPADGRLEDQGRVAAGAILNVKGRSYTAAELLVDPNDAQDFAGGYFAVVYLSPRDYHRVHAPVDGVVEYVRHVPGTLFPVNRMGMTNIGKLFARNERVVVYQRAPAGRVATVLVGAIGVGRISLSFDRDIVTNDGVSAGTRTYTDAPPRLARGQELGVFHLGSTVVMLSSEPLMMLRRAGERVRVGEAIARRVHA